MGRIGLLCEDVTRHYQSETGESIGIFRDLSEDGLGWGDDWQEKINHTLSNVAFFIPIITPSFFKSASCRSELQFFAARAEKLGITELIMPILYIPVPAMEAESPEDPLVAMIKRYQWTSWGDLRFTDRESGKYRAAVNGLARSLMERVAHLAEPEVVAAVEAAVREGKGDDGPGVLERLASMEEALPRLGETVTKISGAVRDIGGVMHEGTASIEAGVGAGKGYAARLTVARRVALELEEPVTRVEVLGQDFTSDLADIDAGLRVFFQQVEEQGIPDENLPDARRMGESLVTLADVTEESMASTQKMIDAIQPVESMSRDLRGPMQRLRAGLVAMVQARETTRAWADLANEHGLVDGD